MKNASCDFEEVSADLTPLGSSQVRVRAIDVLIVSKTNFLNSRQRLSRYDYEGLKWTRRPNLGRTGLCTGIERARYVMIMKAESGNYLLEKLGGPQRRSFQSLVMMLKRSKIVDRRWGWRT